jgi:Tol biopolymer transport system component
MSKFWTLSSVFVVVLAVQLGYSFSVLAKTPGDGGRTVNSQAHANGQIAFDRVVDGNTGNTAIYTVNPNGHGTRQLFSNPNGAGLPHWSPDGRQVSIFCCDDGMAAHIVNRNTGAFRELAPPDPTLEVHCGWWTPDGTRLACESFGPTDHSRRTGVWTIRSSDGGGLTQLTSNPGGDDIPGDFSPNGKRMVFVRSDPNGQVRLFVVRPGRNTPQPITPSGMLVDESFGGSWSPKGNRILFVARADEEHRRAIWLVHANGSGLQKVRMTPGCGGSFSDPGSHSCAAPGWSPDGTRIVFSRFDAMTGKQHIFTSDASGRDLVQVTHGGLGDSNPDWGTHPPYE